MKSEWYIMEMLTDLYHQWRQLLHLLKINDVPEFLFMKWILLALDYFMQ